MMVTVTQPRCSPIARAPEIIAADSSAVSLKDAPLAFADLSLLPRLGFKGRGTIEAMKKRGITVDVQPNKAFRQPDGGLCLVLAPSEVFLLSNLTGDGKRLSEIEAGWRIDDLEKTYPLRRQDSHFWISVTGPAAPAMFAKICGVDLRPEKFPNLSIAQTSIAKMSAIVVRADIANVVNFHVLADSASALYFFSCLVDAGREFGARVVSAKDVQELERS